jgi:hypothetical protein
MSRSSSSISLPVGNFGYLISISVKISRRSGYSLSHQILNLGFVCLG